MADSLWRLTNASSFIVLQDKLESWHRDYHVISCDQNLNRCCELIELTAEIQGQLFSILNLTASEGGPHAGVDTLKMRLLPWLGTFFSTARPSVPSDTSIRLMQESLKKDTMIRELSDSHDIQMRKMGTELCSTRLQLDSVKTELVDAHKELDETKSKSATTLLATEDEILQLKADLRSAQEQAELYKRRLDTVDDHKQQNRLLRDEVSYLSKEKSMLEESLVRSRSLSRSSSPMRRAQSPTRAQLTNGSRHVRLVLHFNDLYTGERLRAQKLLRIYIADLELVQKIIFIAVVESFKAAKVAYCLFKQRMRNTLSPSHRGPESLEDAAVDYIVRNLDLYNAQASVNDVINAMNVNPQISFPPEVDFALISALIRDTCKVAFALQTLDPPVDLAFSNDGELYNDSKYNRSFDSDFKTSLVMHYVWPALMEGNVVLVKGEAVTGTGALWSGCRSRTSSPVRSRSLSPTRTLAFNSRRSPSPERLTAGHL